MTAPKLRFKDFDEDWTAKKLSQVANLTSSKRVHLSDYVSEGIPFFRGKEITELKSGIFPKDILYISKKQYEDFKEKFGAPQNNEILMTAVGTLANTYLINTDFEFYFKDGNLIWFKDINADPNFLMILLDARKNDVLASAIGSTQKALTIANLNKLIFNFPSKEEQTKIASFLSTVDEKISQLTQKHALLSQYKQGMMQKLFSQEIRFKADDGSEFGEWEEKTLIDSIDSSIKWSFTGGPFGSNLKSDDYTESGIRIIQLQNIGDGLFLNDYKIFTSLEKADELLSCNIYPNEILISKMGDPVARCCIVPNHHDRYLMCSDGIRLVVNKNKYSTHFMFYQINYQDFRQKASDVSTGSTRKRIGLSDLKQLPILVPCLDEQTKIANFLLSTDQKIEVVTQQIEQAKQWKKGLLQQMFV
ncbi:MULTISPECIES: restriction endonuclease subunit S [unclassified Acinetobacter]|uniref:restriction endonuclease subunit S n=1 Tax=unclassified Acinetobacter TaxID=196816 RepID=UPI0015D44F33|nr:MULTISPECIES: restriction endonuclease subunit S [unclassified Acinetobacter]